MTQLLTGAIADVTGVAVPLGGLMNLFPCRVTASGGFTVQPVTIEYSPYADTATWISLGTLANNATLLIDNPVERIRAKTVAGMVGSADVFLMTN